MRPLANSIAILILTAVIFAQTGPAPATSATKMQHSDTESLVQIEKDLLKAKLTSDPEAIGKFLADDWVNFSPTGRGWGKPELMEHLRQHSGEVAPFSARQEDLQVFLFGDTAVAVYLEVDTAKPGTNLPFSTLQTDATDVFVKDVGTWKLRMSRGCPHLQQ